MTQEDIARLLSEHKLAEEMFADREVSAFWTKAITAYRDAQTQNISADTALQTAYRACLQSALALVATRNLRVKVRSGSHYMTFYIMQKLGSEAIRKVAIEFDGFRSTRSESIYEPVESAAELLQQLGDILKSLRQGLPLIREWIIGERPALSSMLTAVPN